MSEFGHTTINGPGFHIDSWGVNEFKIIVDGREYRFEDSSRFGPALHKKDGSLRAKPWLNEKHPFWRAHDLWRLQGRQVGADGVCKWREPIPTYVKIINRKIHILSKGEPYGLVIEKSTGKIIDV